jgi:hypothetical protein
MLKWSQMLYEVASNFVWMPFLVFRESWDAKILFSVLGGAKWFQPTG